VTLLLATFCTLQWLSIASLRQQQQKLAHNRVLRTPACLCMNVLGWCLLHDASTVLATISSVTASMTLALLCASWPAGAALSSPSALIEAALGAVAEAEARLDSSWVQLAPGEHWEGAAGMLYIVGRQQPAAVAVRAILCCCRCPAEPARQSFGSHVKAHSTGWISWGVGCTIKSSVAV